MNWLNTIVDDIEKRHPDGEVLIESGGSPSGSYHLGHLRELVTCDAILLELRRRGRKARHIYFVDDLDALRKIPVNIPADYEKYLGRSLCDIPAPNGAEGSYASHFLRDLIEAADTLSMDVEFIYSHKKYREGFFVPAIEKCLENLPQARQALETISGRKLGEEWSPIQVNEDGYLKKRTFISLDKNAKTIVYQDKEGVNKTVSYATGQVKLDWRLDWPGRWWLMQIMVEPFGRDHASAGGSYETGAHLMKDVYGAEAPLPVPYDFINMAGDTKKMSASKGTGLDARDGSRIMPPEVVRFFILRYEPKKRLYFDQVNGVIQLMDEFAALCAKPDKTEAEKQLIYICTHGQKRQTVSSVPFSHLVASYQASLKDVEKTLEVISRTEHGDSATSQADIIRSELKFIDAWLERSAPDDVKFELAQKLRDINFSDMQKNFLKTLGDKVADAPEDADGEWFHKAIYDLKDKFDMQPKQMFETLYTVLIGKTSGPRAGWFLSILPRDWLVKRLKQEA